MIVVDASCLAEVLLRGRHAEAIGRRLLQEDEQAAPHVVDVEVFGVIRRHRAAGLVDETASLIALDGLRTWPGERFGHRALLERAWALRHAVRGWDAMYVALAEVLDAPLITLDRRLVAAPGPRCPIEVVG